jgi:2-polyprenyl-3-methyl-5-hydroxy-6-metoxy-1,4-benzoquinol methylase
MWLQGSWRGRLLDIGCGAGDLLLRMQQYGWDVEGIEQDRIAVANLRKFDIDVTEGTLPNGNLPADSFDVITASHVIEHIGDPNAFLRECFKLLRPGGRLVIATPNADSSGLKKYGSSWVHLDPPRHLVLFTPASLKQALERASFEVDQTRTSCRSAYFATKASRSLRKGAARIGIEFRYALLDKAAAVLVFVGEGLFGASLKGQEIVVVARKKGFSEL